MGSYEVFRSWTPEDRNSLISQLAGHLIAILLAFASWKGRKGLIIFVGAGIGWMLADSSDQFVSSDARFMTYPWTKVIYYSMWTLGFTWTFYSKKHLHLLACVLPLAGGLLVSSSLMYFATELSGQPYMTGFTKSHGLTPSCGPWIYFVGQLVCKSSKDVGVFVGSKHNWQHVTIDQIVGWSLWFICVLIGITVQCRALRPEKYKEMQEMKKKQAERFGFIGRKRGAEKGTPQESLLSSQDR